MRYIERIKQFEEFRAMQTVEQEVLQRASKTREEQRVRLESERRVQRKLQAQQYRQESGVAMAMDELAKFLENPTIRIKVPYDNGERSGIDIQYIGRGSRELSTFDLQPSDPDSAFDTIKWDDTYLLHRKPEIGNHSFNYIVVESRPDGTILFNGGRSLFRSRGSTIQLNEWRVGNREEVISIVLATAFEHPLVHKYSIQNRESFGFG